MRAREGDGSIGVEPWQSLPPFAGAVLQLAAWCAGPLTRLLRAEGGVPTGGPPAPPVPPPAAAAASPPIPGVPTQGLDYTARQQSFAVRQANTAGGRRVAWTRQRDSRNRLVWVRQATEEDGTPSGEDGTPTPGQQYVRTFGSNGQLDWVRASQARGLDVPFDLAHIASLPFQAKLEWFRSQVRCGGLRTWLSAHGGWCGGEGRFCPGRQRWGGGRTVGLGRLQPRSHKCPWWYVGAADSQGPHSVEPGSREPSREAVRAAGRLGAAVFPTERDGSAHDLPVFLFGRARAGRGRPHEVRSNGVANGVGCSVRRTDWHRVHGDREWYLVTTEALFNTDSGLFKYSQVDNLTYQINPMSGLVQEDHLPLFYFGARAHVGPGSFPCGASVRRQAEG